jgi:signal peptidase II
MKRIARITAFWPLLITLVLLDCTTKELVVENFSPAHVPHNVVGNVVRITLAYNPDAAMGLSFGRHSRIAFAAIAAAMLIALVVYRRRPSAQGTAMTIALALIGGGAAGNLLDRMRSARGVVDFIDVGWGDVRFYTFNVADASVFCGAVLLALLLSREDRSRSSRNFLRQSPPP